MSIDIIKRILLLTILVLAQVLVLNNIHLLGCATPLLYVYLELRINRFCPQWANLLWGFVIGLCVDIFSNTPGLAAASMTLMSLLQPYVLNIFVAHDNQDDLKPSFRTLGPVKYISYTSILVFIFCITFFTLETFNFFNWLQWIYNIVGSTIITVLLVLVVENVRRD